MRNHARIKPSFWFDRIGRGISKLSDSERDSTRVVAAYLWSGPHSHVSGLYRLPLIYVSHDTGQSLDQIEHCLEILTSFEFSDYDKVSEFVFVHGHLEDQVNLPLHSRDGKIRWFATWWLKLDENPFLQAFYARFRSALHLPRRHFGRNVDGASRGATPFPLEATGGGTKQKTKDIRHKTKDIRHKTEKGDRGKNSVDAEQQERFLTVRWSRVTREAMRHFANEQGTDVRSLSFLNDSRLVEIKKGVYVIECPEQWRHWIAKHQEGLRKVAAGQGEEVSRFKFRTGGNNV